MIDATGNPAAMDLAVELAAAGGRIGAVGVCGGRRPTLDLDRLVTRELSLIGSLGSPNAGAEHDRHAWRRRLRTKPLISHLLPLNRLAEALALIEDRDPGVVKIVIQP